jgi:hypothetical protein
MVEVEIEVEVEVEVEVDHSDGGPRLMVSIS